MNNSTKFEDRASSSLSTHEGEPSESLCDRLSRTRDTSQRQLPTDQDYAVSTREYQTDQSSPKSAPTAAGPVLETQRQKQPQRCAGVDRSLHISVLFLKFATEQDTVILNEVKDLRVFLKANNFRDTTLD